MKNKVGAKRRPPTLRTTSAESRKRCRAFKRGSTVSYLGGSRAQDLDVGDRLLVQGFVVSHGRTYLRMWAMREERIVVLAPSFVEQVAA